VRGGGWGLGVGWLGRCIGFMEDNDQTDMILFCRGGVTWVGVSLSDYMMRSGGV
jgi:hypothetical protein